MTKVERFLLVAFIFFPFSVFAQENDVKINGRVLDEITQEPIIGAGISLVGSKDVGAVSDIDGYFSFSVKSLPVTIFINYIGYRRQEIDVYDASEQLLIKLSENQNLLDEVVVTGYTSQRRKAITGAITTVNFDEDMAHLPDPDLSRLLQGKAAGVQVFSTSGQPGGGVRFLVRGSNSINGSVEPLYVIDGVFINSAVPFSSGGGNNLLSSALADLNPADIENISILKDANATAIYGSQGANGVVVITTKRGRLNAPSRVNFTVSQGWSDSPKRFDYASGPETAMLFNEAYANTEQDAPGAAVAAGLSLIPNPESLPTYDRISDLFRVAHSSDYQVSVQGGNAAATHYIGFGYTNQQAIVRPSYFTRFSGRVNYDLNITSRLKTGVNLNLARTYRNLSASDNNPSMGVITSAIFPRSYLPIYNDDGTYARWGAFNNHKALIEHLDNNAVTWRTIGSLFGEYTFTPELKFRSTWSLDFSNNDLRNYVNSLIGMGSAANGSSTMSNSNTVIYTAEQLLTYVKTFNKFHSVNVLVGNTVKAQQTHRVGSTGRTYATDVVPEVTAAAVTSGSSNNEESRLVSFFTKAGYTFLGKYTLEGSFRADGSSRFGKSNRWGYFPAGGVTWNAGEESFIKELRWFDALKFRGSFGYSGNQNGIGNYDALGVWNANATYLDMPGTYPARLANPNLTWETTRQTDFGVELSIFRNRLNLNFDVYNKYTYDMLLDVPVPSRSGFSSYTQNFGEMSNKGVEISLQSVNIDMKKFRWTSDFNISFNKNVIERIPQEITLGNSGRNTSILKQGYAVNSFYLFKQLYVDPQTGNAVYEDVDGIDGLTDDDRQVVGSALPDYTGGLTNRFSYGNFDFSFFFYFSVGNKILNMKDYFLVHGGSISSIGFIPRQLERWQKPGDITDIPRMTVYNGEPNKNNSSANNYRGIVNDRSTRYLEDASYLRLKDVSFSYTLPRKLSAWLHLQSAKATLSASNLLTVTPYSGLDPEVSAESANQNTGGYDWATVPQPRTFQVILNVVF